MSSLGHTPTCSCNACYYHATETGVREQAQALLERREGIAREALGHILACRSEYEAEYHACPGGGWRYPTAREAADRAADAADALMARLDRDPGTGA